MQPLSLRVLGFVASLAACVSGDGNFASTCEGCSINAPEAPSNFTCLCQEVNINTKSWFWVFETIDLNNCYENVGGTMIAKQDGGFIATCQYGGNEDAANGTKPCWNCDDGNNGSVYTCPDLGKSYFVFLLFPASDSMSCP
jgi:hypothetical protein